MENKNSFDSNFNNSSHFSKNHQIKIDVNPALTTSLSFIGTMQKVFGVLMIIIGIITCLGIISAIVGVPMIITGVKLFKSGGLFSLASYSNDGAILSHSISALASYWRWSLISIILLVVYYLLFIFVFIGLFSRSGYY